MDVYEARKIPIVALLSQFNLQPASENERVAWFLSPFHAEKTASFKVDKIKNLWYDHAIGKGGNAFDLAAALFQASPSETLKRLSEGNPQSFFSSPAPVLRATETDPEIKILSVGELSHPALTQYLTDRKINLEIAKKYVWEVRFQNIGREFFAIGFRNDKGGYELRNQRFKGSSSPKWFTTIQGVETSKKEALNLFEGFTDFLSCLTHFDAPNLKGDSVVLNSLALANRVAEEVAPVYQSVNLFLDNDEAGARAAALFPQATNQSAKLFTQFKDFNDWIKNRI